MSNSIALFIGGCVVLGATITAGAIVILAVQVEIVANILRDASRRPRP